MTTTQSGILSTRIVELPYETQEAADRAAEMNASLAHMGARTYRGGYDWGFAKYSDARAVVLASGVLQKHLPKAEPVLFEKGDLVKIFKTVTDGDVLWQDKIDMKPDAKYGQEFQQGMDPTLWNTMFYDSLPAKLVQDGKTMFGALEPFYEQGMGSVAWAIREYGYDSYGALRPLKNGDELTVYSNVRDGEIEWQGEMDFGPYEITKLGWTEVVRETKHMDTDKWLRMSFQNRPVLVTPKAP